MRWIIFLCFLPLACFGQRKFAENLGRNVNSTYADVAPLIAPDAKTLYFIRVNHPSNSAGPYNTQDIWSSRYNPEKNKWTRARHMGSPFNKHRVNGILGISPDGNRVLIFGAYKKGRYKGRGFSMVHKTSEGWTEPEELDIKRFSKMSRGKYEGAHLSNDGKTLVINLSEQKDDPASDLYVSFYKEEKDEWTEPAPLGKDVNTKYAETSPFLASDNKTLYFSSNRPGGNGDFDIYRTKRLDDSWSRWTSPQNLGPLINTPGREGDYCISAAGDYAYMATSEGEHGNMDIIRIPLSAANQPEPVVLVQGKVYDKDSGKEIDASISYETLPEGKEAGIASSDPKTGSYKIILPYGRKYGFSASAEGYISVSENLDLTKTESYKEITRDLYLIPVKKGQTVRLNNIFFEHGEAELQAESYPELQRVTNFLKKNRDIRIEISGHTDNTGADNLNMQLSGKRADAVKAYLIEQGIKESRIRSKGYGQNKPIAPNDTEEGRAQNRRVEFTIL